MKYLLAYLFLLSIQCSDPKPLDHSKKKKADAPATVADKPVEKADTATIEPEMPPLALDYDTAAWTEVNRLDPSIRLDLRYATANNFVKEKMYECPRCFLRPDVARAIVKAHKALQKKGYGLKMYDCYRPRPIQWKLWNKVPDTRYVADPRKGSMHNRGMAVDLTIVDKNGQELDMGTDFDYFGKEAYHSYAGHSDQVQENRQLLVETMQEHRFRSTSTEWWHYSYIPKTFPLDDWLWKCN